MRQRIARGMLMPGERLPSLDSLAEQFGVARVTVRQACAILAQEELISPQQGRGTFVRQPAARPNVLRVETTLRDLVETYRSDLPHILNLFEGAAIPDLSSKDGRAADEYYYMRRVHYRDEIAYCVISIYLAGTIFRRDPKRFRENLVIPVLADMPDVVIERARQTLTVSNADVEVAAHLKIAINAPVVEVRRVFNGADDIVIYFAHVTYRSDFVRVEMDLQP